MSQPTWKCVQLKTVLVADPGWHYDDNATITKLAASVQRHGQLRPLVVRGVLEDDSMCTLVEGHKLLGALLALGTTEAMAVHLGEIDADAALRVALALELDFETDYARMVQAVSGLLARGVSVADLAAGSPFDSERLSHFATLSTLDWSQFGADSSQARLDWDALEAVPDVPPMLVLDVATGVVTEAVAPAADVLEDVTEPFTYIETAEGITTSTDNPDVLDHATAAAIRAAQSGQPAAAEPAAAPAGGPETQPATATKVDGEAGVSPSVHDAERSPSAPRAAKAQKAAKVPKAPDAQLGLF